MHFSALSPLDSYTLNTGKKLHLDQNAKNATPVETGPYSPIGY